MYIAIRVSLLALILSLTAGVWAIVLYAGSIAANLNLGITESRKVIASVDLNSPITNANTAFKNLADATGDWSDASKQQARDVRALLSAGGRAVDAVTEDAKALKETTNQATELTRALTEDAQTANSSIAASQPLLEASRRFLDDADKRLRDPAIDQIESHIQGMTASGDGILADARKLADKETSDFLKPVKWYMYPVKKGSQFLDISAAIARHVP